VRRWHGLLAQRCQARLPVHACTAAAAVGSCKDPGPARGVRRRMLDGLGPIPGIPARHEIVSQPSRPGRRHSLALPDLRTHHRRPRLRPDRALLPGPTDPGQGTLLPGRTPNQPTSNPEASDQLAINGRYCGEFQRPGCCHLSVAARWQIHPVASVHLGRACFRMLFSVRGATCRSAYRRPWSFRASSGAVDGCPSYGRDTSRRPR
jgi:hypothetical protein